MSGSHVDLLTREIASLREVTGELYAVLDSSFDEIYVADGTGTTLMVNRACERLYGMPKEELVGRSVYELERRGIYTPSATALALKERRSITILQRTRSGQQVLVTATPVFLGPEIHRVVCNSRDVTELLDLRERLDEAEDKALRYRSELARLRSRDQDDSPGQMLVTPGLDEALRQARRAARVNVTVLVLGESGVGKDVIASDIHNASGRRTRPLVKLNCGAIPPDLLESELFGYEPGSFTGARKEGRVGHVELAHGGTLFLNEIGELTLPLQVKLLQVLQDRQVMRIGGSRPISVDVRIIAATNRDLREMVKTGQFRTDLYYRLNVVPILIPPLRSRPSDIPVLAEHFLERVNRKYGLNCRFAPGLLKVFLRFPWPGNVRELENVVERLAVMAEDEELTAESAAVVMGLAEPQPDPADSTSELLRPLKEATEEVERRLVRAAYDRYHNTYLIASALGISQASAVRKVQKHVRDSSVNYNSRMN